MPCPPLACSIRAMASPVGQRRPRTPLSATFASSPSIEVWLRSQCGMLLVGIRASAGPVFGGRAVPRMQRGNMHLEIRARIDTSSSLPQTVVLQFYVHPPSAPPPSCLSFQIVSGLLLEGLLLAQSCRLLCRLAGISVTSSPLAGRTTDVCLPTHSVHRSPPHKFLPLFFPIAALLATDRARPVRPWPTNLGEVVWPAPLNLLRMYP